MSTISHPEIETQPRTSLDIVDVDRPELWTLATDIEAAVFIEKDYVESAAELAEEYAPYLDRSEFLLARLGDRALGSVRCIQDGPKGFKTLTDISEGRLTATQEGAQLLNAVPRERILEIGTLAVAPEWRSNDDGRVAVQLYGAILGYMRERGLTHVLASFDEDYFNNFKLIFADTVTAVGPAIDYMGSPTVPALMNVYEMHEHTRSISQELYDTIQEASENVH